ncbi:DMT family transporter [Fusibacter bizertensis]
MTNNKSLSAIGFAILAALLYGISAPASKLLLGVLSPTMMAALLYLGAGLGMLFVNIILALSGVEKSEAKMTKKEMPFIIGMILLDIAAPILLMMGLKTTHSANASLLNNFEIVATAVIAMLLFRESVGRRMWLAIALITLSSLVLSLSETGSLSFSVGSVFVLLACIAWGFENNCTRMLSLKDPLQIVVIKGFGSGLGALIIAYASRGMSYQTVYILLAMGLGFVAYGLSIYFYIKAQRTLGAARTSAYYAAAPFIGVLVSWLVLKEHLNTLFIIALGIMLLGNYFAITEKHKHTHKHKELVHEHKHNHNDAHHLHIHDFEIEGEHSHLHVHAPEEHRHSHTPDLHHTHTHAK